MCDSDSVRSFIFTFQVKKPELPTLSRTELDDLKEDSAFFAEVSYLYI